MVRKLIDVDENIWLMFTAICKLQKVKIGDKLNSVLNDFNDKSK